MRRRRNTEERTETIPPGNDGGKGYSHVPSLLDIEELLNFCYGVRHKGKQELNLFLIPGGDVMSLTIIVTQVQNPLVTVLKSKNFENKYFLEVSNTCLTAGLSKTDLKVIYRHFSNYLNICHVFRCITGSS